MYRMEPKRESGLEIFCCDEIARRLLFLDSYLLGATHDGFINHLISRYDVGPSFMGLHQFHGSIRPDYTGP